VSRVLKNKTGLIIAVVVLAAVVISVGYALMRGKGKAPGDTGLLVERPEETREIAGVKVTTGGPANPDGSVRLASFAVSGGMIGHMPGNMFSPDGRMIAFQAARQGRGEAIWAMLLDGSAGNLLAETGGKEHAAGTLVLRLLGWSKDGRVFFARQGTQPDGPHQGERGLSIRVAQPGAEVREISWLAVPSGIVNQVDFFPEKESIFIHITGSLWRVNIVDGRNTSLKEGLPSYDGLFYPRLSPTGDYYSYELNEQGRNGIFSLNTATGEEIALARNDENFNFYPQWSTDGRRLAYYTAPQKGDRAAESIYDRYDLIPEEDGPLAVAPGVDIVAPDGKKTAGLSVPGAKIANFRWSADGRQIAFAAGQVKSGQNAEGEMPAIAWQSMWVTGLNGEMRKMADLTIQEDTGITIINVAPGGRQVHYLVSGPDSNTLWAVEEGKQPVEVDSAGGPWLYGGMMTTYGKDFFLSRAVNNNADEIFRIRDAGVTRATADGGRKYILGVMGNRLVYIQEATETNEGRLVVLELAAAH